MTQWVIRPVNDDIQHHGVEGQKWGTRRWQYEDGSLTPEGYVHYGYGKGHGNAVSRRVGAIADYAGRRIGDVKDTVTFKKGFTNTLANAYLGTNRRASLHNASADYRAKKSEASKTKFNRNVNKNASYNNRELAKQYSKISNSKGIVDRIVNNVSFLNVPQKTFYRGKDTTYGKKLIKTILVGTAAALTVDAALAKFAPEYRENLKNMRYGR